MTACLRPPAADALAAWGLQWVACHLSRWLASCPLLLAAMQQLSVIPATATQRLGKFVRFQRIGTTICHRQRNSTNNRTHSATRFLRVRSRSACGSQQSQHCGLELHAAEQEAGRSLLVARHAILSLETVVLRRARQHGGWRSLKRPHMQPRAHLEAAPAAHELEDHVGLLHIRLHLRQGGQESTCLLTR